ncbi:MAG: alpha/beta hydrolase [Saprospiraceae bacterium]|nr:alpha/beta hydrolase [Saprospiraceae bacterium]
MKLKSKVIGSDCKISVNGISICYDDFGTGNIPIIFIHGFPFDKSTWRKQMDYFNANYRVISYDIRGFGKSTSNKEIHSIDLYADDLIEFMDVLKIEKAIICGLSMGGYITMNAVCRFPGRFQAVILCDTQCIDDTPEIKLKRSQTISQIKAGKVKLFADNFVNSIFSTQTLESKTELVEEIRSLIYGTSAAAIIGALNAIAQREDVCNELKALTLPVLILCGEEDLLTPPSQSEIMNAMILNSKLEMIDHAGHLSNLEKPNDFNLKIANFVLGLKDM